MFRLAVLSPLAAVLALGSVAYASDEGIIDPWSVDLTSGWFSDPLLEPSKAIARQADNAGAARALPLASEPGDHVMVVEPWSPEAVEVTPDPWVRPQRNVPRAVSVAPSSTSKGRHHSNWAYVIRDIVDPWRRGATGVSRDPMIVDPWAR